MSSSPPRPDESREERAERLAPVAAQWVDRLRGEDVDVLAAELLDPLPRRDLYALIGLLGGATDPSTHPDIWWGWARLNVLAMRRPAVEAPEEPDDDEETSIDRQVREMAARGKTAAEIAVAVGRSRSGISRRLARLRQAEEQSRGAGEAAA